VKPNIYVDQNNPHFKAVQKMGATGLLRGVGVPSGWANATYFYPNKKVDINEFLKTWKLKYKYDEPQTAEDMSISDAMYFAALLSGKNQIKNDFEQKWNALALSDFNLQRPITRIELAAVLNEYDVFNKFDVDIFGTFLK
jgi:hypothetical protein